MKKLYNLLYLILIALVAACTPEEKNLFEDSSAKRADAAIEKTLELLTSASDGWLMEYFPESLQKYGGYNLILSFDKEGVVKVAGEIADPTDITTSTYSVKQSAGVVLSFDTYNQIFHFFSDPANPAGIGKKGYGFEGDYDFLVLESSAEKIVLKGKKAGGKAVLTPMKGDWSSLISKIQDADEAMTFSLFKLELNGEDIPVSISYRSLIFTYEENGNTISQTASYIVTETGYKFYEEIVIKGTTLNGFIFDADNTWFTESENSSIKLIPVIPPLNQQFVNGNWYIAYSTLGAFAQPYFAFCKQNFLDEMGETLNYAYIGSALYDVFGFNFDSGGYKGLLGLDYTLKDEDKVSLVFNFSGEGNGVWYHNNAGFHYLLNPFGYSAARNFTLTTDNIAAPTYIILTEDENPNNVIKLFQEIVSNPFDN